jgi:hypothetical protein
MLAKMRKLLRTPDRWMKYDLSDEFGRRCLVGAYDEAVGNGRRDALWRLLTRHVQRDGFVNLHDFNDTRNTQHHHILAFLDHVEHTLRYEFIDRSK